MDARERKWNVMIRWVIDNNLTAWWKTVVLLDAEAATAKLEVRYDKWFHATKRGAKVKP